MSTEQTESTELVINPGGKPTPECYAKFQALMQQSREEKLRRQHFIELLKRYEERLFDYSNVPDQPIPRWSINGTTVCTAGNLTAITAQSKTGKSAVIEAMKSAVLCADAGIEGRDNLGITAAPPAGRALIHFDTEQSRYDADQLVRRAVRRAGLDALPAWVWSLSLAGVSPADIRKLLPAVLWEAGRQGGTAAVLIDGVADLVNDVNDAEECNGLVTELHNLAIKYDCPIVGVVHENPGADSGKARGHLGSQLERKAESNLRLRKSDEVTVLFSVKQRGAPILEKDGPRFAWSNSEAMHVSVESAGVARDDAKRAHLVELASEVFEGHSSLKFADMSAAIVKARDCTKRTAERKIADMIEHKVITKQGFGMYSPTTDKAPTNQPT